MRYEIDGTNIRINAKRGSLLIHVREQGDDTIISFEIGDGFWLRGGRLPTVEFTERDILLRHLGNNIEQIV